MSLPHEDRGFADLVAVVARRRRLAPALVEKDYWVTHALWGLHAGERFAETRRAHEAIAPMLWGPRITFDEARGAIREWVAKNLV